MICCFIVPTPWHHSEGRHAARPAVLDGSSAMDTTHPAGNKKPDMAGALRLPSLCLISILAMACSVDVGKLRAKASVALDAATDRPLGAVGVEVGGADADGSDDAMDTLVSPLDVPSVDESLGRDDGSDLSNPDGAGDAASPEALSDSSDLPLPPEDGSGVPTDSSGSGGSGDSDGQGGQGGAGGTGGTSIDAGGDSTGFDSGLGGGGGAGGSGGTGGTRRTGGAGGTAATAGSGGNGGGGGSSGTGGGDPDLVLWYEFDESSGTIAADSSPSGAGTRDGTLGTAGVGGSARFSTDCQVGTHALSLSPSTYTPSSAGGYVTVPAPASLAPAALTIAVWVKLAAATTDQDWERIFDFGSGPGSNAPYVFLMARAGDATNRPVRVGMSSVGHHMPGEERLESASSLTANVWHHIAIVLPAGTTYTGILYIDGEVAATNDNMTIHLSDVGTTTMNWLGRSPYSSDPYFYGSLDDFRIYKRALSAAEITTLMALR